MRMHDLLVAAAQDRDDRPAIIDHDVPSCGWAEMAAGATAALAARPGDRVVTVLENTAAMVTYLFDALQLGTVNCPVNARLRVPELERIVAHSDAAAVVLGADVVMDTGGGNSILL